MKHKTITRLLIKLMGIYFLLSGITGLVTGVVYFIFSLEDYGAYGSSFYMAYPLSVSAAALTAIVLGLFLLLASNWLVSKLIPSNRPYCPSCGYELTGSMGEHCPECGVALPLPLSAHASPSEQPVDQRPL